jgi:endonuclease/exonuclease/phosphatase family metal-dependent hydrolase
VKDSFDEELDKFPTYLMKILLGDFNDKVGRENIFKQTNWNECLHEIINDNGVGVVNFATSKNLIVKSIIFPHSKIHKFTWTPPDGKPHNQIDHILIEKANVRERLAVSKQTTHKVHMERFDHKKLN